ncbi:MAG TPA: hypothetical protein VMH37_14785 [Candidatus Binataceae bacterium]|nr:hypothetical protein [Candidatus Binataceae bacterium]
MNGSSSDILLDAAKSLGSLLDLGAQLGRDMLEILDRSRQSIGSMSIGGTQLRNMSIGGMKPWASRGCGCNCGTGSSGCGCKIPPACWEPVCAGEIVSHVCPGSNATLRIRIRNCSWHAHEYKIDVPKAKAGVTVSPVAMNLGPMEHGFVTVTMPIPADASHSFEEDLMVWIRGCRTFYLCWDVRVASRGAECCHEIEIEDCADTIHHWYDHFYCQHPCQH